MSRGFRASESSWSSTKLEIKRLMKLRDSVGKKSEEERRKMFEPKSEQSVYDDVARQIAAYKEGTKINRSEGYSEEQLRSKHVNDKHEIYYEFDKDGNMVFNARGNETTVQIPNLPPPLHTDEVARGGSSWHNHPVNGNNIFGFPPSVNDLQTAMFRGHTSMTVDSVEGTYKIEGKLGNTRVSAISDYDEVWGAVFEKHISEYGSVSNGNRAFNRLLVLAANEALSKKLAEYGLKYTFTPAPGFYD